MATRPHERAQSTAQTKQTHTTDAQATEDPQHAGSRAATRADSEIVVDLRDLQTRGPRNRSTYEKLVKPAMDRFLGLALALATLPLQVVLAVAVIISMGRPVLFLQERAGQGGAPFMIYKFRTMLPDRRRQQLPYAGTDRRQVHKTADDPRITRVGAFLRKWSLDELPQLWNVVKGDMSLVGPRPELTSVIAEHYEPWQHRRHEVKPGMTGLWQISARGEDDLMYLCTEVDLEYVDSVSLSTDLRILAKTIPAAAGSNKGS